MIEEDEFPEPEVVWSEENQIFIARSPQFPMFIGEGDTEEEALEDLFDLVECEFDGEDEEDEEQKLIEEIKNKNAHMITKTNKRIGIVGWAIGENSFGVTNDYENFFDRFGNVDIIRNHHTPETHPYDLVVMPGGADLSSHHYGQTPSVHNSNCDVNKEYFFQHQLKSYIESGSAIFGICLGFQMLNVHFGGSLVQHLVQHPQSPGRWKPAHRVYRIKELRNDKTGFEVNSHHHQAVVENTLAEGLMPLLACNNNDRHLTGDGDIIEAFIHNELQIAGVQWHPEQWLDAYSIKLITELLQD